MSFKISGVYYTKHFYDLFILDHSLRLQVQNTVFASIVSVPDQNTWYSKYWKHMPTQMKDHAYENESFQIITMV